MAREVAGVLSLKLSQGRARTAQDGREWLCDGGQPSPGSSSKSLRQQTPATLISTTLPREDNQQLPTDLPKRASRPPAYPQQANAPAAKRG
jgi:hypothetical protein